MRNKYFTFCKPKAFSFIKSGMIHCIYSSRGGGGEGGSQFKI